MSKSNTDKLEELVFKMYPPKGADVLQDLSDTLGAQIKALKILVEEMDQLNADMEQLVKDLE